MLPISVFSLYEEISIGQIFESSKSRFYGLRGLLSKVLFIPLDFNLDKL
jgi:hypothetical protein